MLAASFGAADGGLLAAVIVLIGLSAVLALAETSLVRTGQARARSLEEQRRLGAKLPAAARRAPGALPRAAAPPRARLPTRRGEPRRCRGVAPVRRARRRRGDRLRGHRHLRVRRGDPEAVGGPPRRPRLPFRGPVRHDARQLPPGAGRGRRSSSGSPISSPRVTVPTSSPRSPRPSSSRSPTSPSTRRSSRTRSASSSRRSSTSATRSCAR